MFIQDFVAPFYTFLSAEYEMEYLKLEDELSNNKVIFRSLATVKSGKRIRKAFDFWFEVENGRINKMYINKVSANIEATWEEADF